MRTPGSSRSSLWLLVFHALALRRRFLVAGLLLRGLSTTQRTALAFQQSPSHNLRQRRSVPRPQHPFPQRL